MAAAAHLAAHRIQNRSELDVIRARRAHTRNMSRAASYEAQYRLQKRINLDPESWPMILKPFLLFCQQCDKVALSPSFANYILFCILLAGALVGVQTYPGFEEDQTILWLDLIILYSFTLEVALKILGEGMGPYYYFVGPEWAWNNFDFLIVVFSLPFIPFAAGQIKLLRLIRLMRLAKAFRKIPQLQMILMGLIGGLKSIIYIVILMVLIFYLYACAGIIFFRDNDPFHFKSIEVSMLTLLGVATLDGWGEIMFINYFGCDEYDGGFYTSDKSEEDEKFGGMIYCGTPSRQPVASSLYFLSFVLLAAFCILSLFIGAVAMSMVESMADMKKSSQETQEKLLQTEMRNLQIAMDNKKTMDRKTLRRLRLMELAFQGQDVRIVENENLVGHNKDTYFVKKYRDFAYTCQDIAESDLFQQAITFVIIMAGVTVGLSTDRKIANEYKEPLRVLDVAILYVFVAEMVLKIIGEEFRPWRYFNDNWNRFDFIVVVGSFLPTGSSSLITILRLLRLLRVLKLLKALPQLQVIVQALLKGLSAIIFISVILAMFYYFFGIIAITFFGDNDAWHFGSLHMSMLTLFQCSTMDNWSSIMWISLYGCDMQDGDNPDLCVAPRRQFLMATLFFLLIILIGALVLLTLFIGVVGMSMEEASQEQKKEKEIDDRAIVIGEVEKLDVEQVRLYKEVFETMDLISSGRIKSDMLKLGLLLAGLQMNDEDFQEVWNKVDRDGSDGIDFAEFLEFMCDLKSNLLLLHEMSLEPHDKKEVEEALRHGERRQFNFTKKVDVKKLEKHGSILDPTMSASDVVESAIVEDGTEEEVGPYVDEDEEALEARKKEEQKNLFKASALEAAPQQSFAPVSSKKSKKKDKDKARERGEKESTASKYEMPGRGSAETKETAEGPVGTPSGSPEKRKGGQLSPDTESTKREEQALGTPSPAKTLKPSVPPLSKTVVTPTGDRHKYTVIRASSSFQKIGMGAGEGLDLEETPETPLRRPQPQGAGPYTPSKKAVKSLVVSI